MNKTADTQQIKTASFLPPVQGILQRKCAACGNHTAIGGKCAECGEKKGLLQRKLTVGASNDLLEEEADRVADQVTAVPAHSTVSGIPPRIQRYAGRATEDTGTAPASVDRILASPGRRLEPVLRADMEQRFGYDFSGVRVHSGDAAERSARDINAHAYTVGHNIVFGTGQFVPGTREGRWLLAHELTHVVQQTYPNGIRAGQSHEKRGLSPVSQFPNLFSLRRQQVSDIANPVPKIDYKKAEKANRRFAEPDSLGWVNKLETVSDGAFKEWIDLWKAGDYNGFADKVAQFQRNQGFSGKKIDGILGLESWARIGGIGEAMAGIEHVVGKRSESVCTMATKERIERANKIATGKTFSLPRDKDATTYRIILQTIEGRMLDVDKQYRGTGAAGAIVYAGFGTFVPEQDIWSGGLRPGAALQVWRQRKDYELLQAGEIEEKGKKRRINSNDASFFGTSAVFVRYDDENAERMLVRHFGRSEWWEKSNWAVWVAANVTSGEERKGERQ